MNWAEWFLVIVGVVMTLSLATCAVLCCFFSVRLKVESCDEVQQQIGYRAAISNLRSDAWWFSEDPATMNLLIDLSDGVKADEARMRWRKYRQGSFDTRTQQSKTEPKE